MTETTTAKYNGDRWVAILNTTMYRIHRTYFKTEIIQSNTPSDFAWT